MSDRDLASETSTPDMEDSGAIDMYDSGPVDSAEAPRSPDPRQKIPPPSTVLDSGCVVDSGLVSDDAPVDLADTIDRLNLEESDEEESEGKLYFRQDQDGNTQLHIAIFHRLMNAVLALLDVCPHPDYLDLRNDSGYAAIHLAVLTQQPEIVRRLLIAGAMVNTRDGNGNTALHLASMYGDTRSLVALTSPLGVLQPKSKLTHQQAKARTLPQALNQKNYDGETCVHVAAKAGQIEILGMLKYYGADMNSTENKAGRTALHIAIERCDTELLKYLIEECSSICQIRTYSGHTALQLAGGDFKQRLLETGYKRQEDESDLETESDSDSEYEDDNSMCYNPNANMMSCGGLRARVA